MSTTRAAVRRERPRRQRPAPRRGPWLASLSLLLLGAVAWYALQLYGRHHVTLTFVREGGVPGLELTFYPDRLAFASPSPPPPIGTATLEGGRAGTASITVGSDLVPDTALVRYRGPGVGSGFVFVALGKRLAPISLRTGRRLEGRVGEPIPFWCYGWRCAGYEPIADAEVIVMGGGEHGVDLARARTDTAGRFVIEGVDDGLDGLGLRVLARGYGIHHQSLHDFADTAEAYAVIAMAPTDRIVGRVEAPPGVQVKGLRVLARGLPGVEAVVDANGDFVIDHVPSGLLPHLIVFGLAGTLAQSELPAAADGAHRIEISEAAVARGRVVDAESGAALPEALVFYGERDAVRADGAGRYQLPGVLPGDVELQAQWHPPESRRPREKYFGRKLVTVVAGQTLDVDIPVTTR